MDHPPHRDFEAFPPDPVGDMTPLNCPGCQIFVKFLPAPAGAARDGKYLIASLKIIPREDVTEYRVTFMENQDTRISDEQIRRLVRRAHQRGLYKSCQKIVSFIEYGDSETDQAPADPPADGCPVQHRFNFII